MHVDGWQVISLLSVDICIPESYVNHLSHFASVPPRLCVHYLDVIPVKGVTSPEVVGAQGRFLIVNSVMENTSETERKLRPG